MNKQYLRQNAFWPFFDKKVISSMTKKQAVARRSIIHFYSFLSFGEGVDKERQGYCVNQNQLPDKFPTQEHSSEF